MRQTKKPGLLLLVLLLSLFVSACQQVPALPGGQADLPQRTTTRRQEAGQQPTAGGKGSRDAAISEDGSYTTAEDVARYLHTYKRLPGNFITKAQARKLGWEGGSLEAYAPGKAIGGDRFGNYEGLLPTKKGRVYYECDIDTLGQKSRGAKRIVYSNDGLIYYTEDHYQSFTLLTLED